MATVVSSARVDLSWDAVPNATQYAIFRSNTPGTETIFTSNSPATATTFSNTDLFANTQYCYFIRANVQGLGISDPSPERCVTTNEGPQPPNSVTAFATSATSITVSWDAAPNANFYYVQMSTSGGPFQNVGSTAAPTTTLVLQGLQPSTTYSFQVSTQGGNLISAFSSPPVSATTFSAGLEGYYRFDDKTGTSAIDQSGFQRTGTLAGGAVFVTTDAAPLRDAFDKNGSSLSFPSTTSSMSSGVTHNFGGPSTLSLWVKLLAAPTGDITFAGRRQASCGVQSWSLGHDMTGLYFAGDSVFRRPFGVSLTPGTWTHVAVSQSGGVIRMYINGVLVTTATYTSGQTTAAPFQLGAIGGCPNLGGTFRLDELRMFSRQLTDAEVDTFGRAPTAPTNLAPTEIKSNRINMAWTAPTTGADKYYVFKGTASGNQTFFTSNATTTFKADHLTPSQTTSWKIQAQRNGLLSPFSTEIVVTTLAPPPAPTNVAAVISTCCNPKRVNLTWTAEPRAISYLVWESQNGAAFTRIGVPTATTFQTGGRPPGNYAYYVQSFDDGFSTGPQSTTVLITIP